MMLVGTPEAEAAAAGAAEASGLAEASSVADDLDVLPEHLSLPVDKDQVYLAKVARRVSEYTPERLCEPREGERRATHTARTSHASRATRAPRRRPATAGKRLLVLDVDYTLFDHRSPAETPMELARPYLHEFLASAYLNYEIVIWSATSMKWARRDEAEMKPR